jgi:hypothetical protein
VVVVAFSTTFRTSWKLLKCFSFRGASMTDDTPFDLKVKDKRPCSEKNIFLTNIFKWRTRNQMTGNCQKRQWYIIRKGTGNLTVKEIKSFVLFVHRFSDGHQTELLKEKRQQIIHCSSYCSQNVKKNTYRNGGYYYLLLRSCLSSFLKKNTKIPTTVFLT